MIREPLDVYFVTTGRYPTPEEFQLISEHIKANKEKWARELAEAEIEEARKAQPEFSQT